jgi:hypothetical protein
MKPGKRFFPALAGISAAFLFLSVLLNLDYPANRFFSPQLLQPSLDVWFLFILLGIAACCGKRFLFWTSLPVWALFLVLRLFRIGDTALPMYLNRPFNLSIDSGYLFDLYDLLKTTAHDGDFLLISISVAAVALGVIISSWYAWQAAAGGLLNNRVRFAFLISSSVILGSGLIWKWYPVKAPVMVRLGREILSIRQHQEQQQTIASRIAKTARDRKADTSTLKGLQDADVLLFVIESYGRTVFSRSDYRQTMEATMTRFAGVLLQHGFTAVSSYLDSPTYGGSSWLAHSTLEFGLRVENDIEDNALLHSSLPSLASCFGKNGYRTVSVMPGTRFALPEGDNSDYEQVYYAWHFNYQGPTFGWAPMPDQFVLDWVQRHEVAKSERPLFVRYVLISSHAAFNIQPPFIADWKTIGDGSIYHDRRPIYYPIYWPDLQNAGEAYLRSLDYEFTTLGDYLTKFVSGDTLIIIMGDHQPNLQLTGTGEPWSVPVHIISRNPRLLAPFQKRGYTPGLIPEQPLPHAGMETFFQDFLQDFR